MPVLALSWLSTGKGGSSKLSSGSSTVQGVPGGQEGCARSSTLPLVNWEWGR